MKGRRPKGDHLAAVGLVKGLNGVDPRLFLRLDPVGVSSLFLSFPNDLFRFKGFYSFPHSRQSNPHFLSQSDSNGEEKLARTSPRKCFHQDDLAHGMSRFSIVSSTPMILPAFRVNVFIIFSPFRPSRTRLKVFLHHQLFPGAKKPTG